MVESNLVEVIFMLYGGVYLPFLLLQPSHTAEICDDKTFFFGCHKINAEIHWGT